jgi:serine/threonine protein kinase
MIPQPDTAPDELLPGSTLGKYEILRKLATGGMAEIYLARSRGVAGFEKTVVLKRILPHIAEDVSFVHMFLDEARLAATLQHPNIADVYDVGEVSGTPFFTMEYIHGQDVRSIRAATRRRNEQVPISIALAIVHGTAAALDYAHRRTGPDGQPLDLVHRDVSSSNIVVSYDGAIKLLDFGIARAASHQHKTQIGMLKGKTPYMSPEQCRAQRLDRRSDLFSLGTVLYELSVGQRPFRGENDFAIMEKIVHGKAPLPSTIAPDYPAELEAIVMRLLAPRPDERYQTAEDLLHDLEQFISKHGLWVSSRPLGKYMRILFAERVDAWERAASDGVALSEHVAETITSESQQVERITPPSLHPPAYPPAHPRLLRLSQEFPAVGMPSQQMAAVEPPFEESATEPEYEPAAPARPPTAPAFQQMAQARPSFQQMAQARPSHQQLSQARPSYQELAAMHPQLEQMAPVRPPPEQIPPAPLLPPMEPGFTGADPAQRAATGSSSHALLAASPDDDVYPELRSGRPALIALGILITTAIIASAVYAWPMLFPKQAVPPTSPAAVEVVAPRPSRSDEPTAAQAQPQPQQPAPQPQQPAPQQPAPQQPAAPQTATAQTAPPQPPAAAPPAPTPAPTPTPTAKAAAPTPRPTAPAATAAPAAAPKRLPPKPPAKAPPRVPSPKAPKDNAWDRDSPFLPSSS